MTETKEEVPSEVEKSKLEEHVDALKQLSEDALVAAENATSHRQKCDRLAQQTGEVHQSCFQLLSATALFEEEDIENYFSRCEVSIRKVLEYNKEFAKTGGFAKLLSGGDAKSKFQELETELDKLAEEGSLKIQSLIPIFETYEVREGYKHWSPSTLKICNLFAASPSGEIIFTAHYGQKDIELFEPAKYKAHRVKRIPTNGKIHAIATFEDNLFVSCSGDPSIQVYKNTGVSLYDYELAQNLIEHEGDVEAIVVDAEEKRMYSGSYDGTVAVWNLELMSCVQTWNIGRQVTTGGLCVNDGRLVVLSRPSSRTENTYVLIYDLANLKQPKMIAFENMAHIFHGVGMYGQYVFHPAPGKAFRNEIWTTNLETMEQHGVVSIDGGLAPDCFGWKMCGPFLIIAKYGESDVYIFDVRTSSVICTLQHSNDSDFDPVSIRGIGFVGPYLATCCRPPLRGDPALTHSKNLHFWSWGFKE